MYAISSKSTESRSESDLLERDHGDVESFTIGMRMGLRCPNGVSCKAFEAMDERPKSQRR